MVAVVVRAVIVVVVVDGVDVDVLADVVVVVVVVVVVEGVVEVAVLAVVGHDLCACMLQTYRFFVEQSKTFHLFLAVVITTQFAWLLLSFANVFLGK